MKLLKLFGLIVGFSAVVVLTYFLVTHSNECLIFFEPNLFIRIPEIIMGLGTIIIYIGMFVEVLK